MMTWGDISMSSKDEEQLKLGKDLYLIHADHQVGHYLIGIIVWI